MVFRTKRTGLKMTGITTLTFMPTSMEESSAKGTSLVSSSHRRMAKLHMSAARVLMSSGRRCKADEGNTSTSHVRRFPFVSSSIRMTQELYHTHKHTQTQKHIHIGTHSLTHMHTNIHIRSHTFSLSFSLSITHTHTH